jgi:phytoene dehydrogenase-like protein
MGAITQAMARAASGYGVRIDVRSPVREIIVERGRAAGVVLGDGTPVRARAVVANVDPRQLFQTLLPREVVPRAVAARMKRWKAGSGTFRMNVALSKLPAFSALPGPGDHHTSGIILAPSLSYMDKAYRDCVRHGWSKAPIIEVLIPRRLTIASPHPARTLRACSANTSHRNLRMVPHGISTAKPSPT